jgi:hypothetical protein
VEPLLILVKPPQVISLDFQKYDGVFLFVVLVVFDVDAPFFSERPPTSILSLHFNQYFSLFLLSPRMSGVLLSFLSYLKASKEDWESINKPPPITEQCHP